MSKKAQAPTRPESKSDPQFVTEWDPSQRHVDRLVAYLDIMIVARNRFVELSRSQIPSWWQQELPESVRLERQQTRERVAEELNGQFNEVYDRLFPSRQSTSLSPQITSPLSVVQEIVDGAIAEFADIRRESDTAVLRDAEQWLSEFVTWSTPPLMDQYKRGKSHREEWERHHAHLVQGAGIRRALLRTLAAHSRRIPPVVSHRDDLFHIWFNPEAGRIPPTNDELFTWLTTAIPQKNCEGSQQTDLESEAKPTIEELKPHLAPWDRERLSWLATEGPSLSGLLETAAHQRAALSTPAVSSDADVQAVLVELNVCRVLLARCDKYRESADKHIRIDKPGWLGSHRLSLFLEEGQDCGYSILSHQLDLSSQIGRCTNWLTVAARNRGVLGAGQQLDDAAEEQLRFSLTVPAPPPHAPTPPTGTDAPQSPTSQGSGMPLCLSDSPCLKKVLEELDSILGDPSEANPDALRLFDDYYHRPSAPKHPFAPSLLWYPAKLPLLRLLAGDNIEGAAVRHGNTEGIDKGDLPLPIKTALRKIRSQFDRSTMGFLCCQSEREELQLHVQQVLKTLGETENTNRIDDDETQRYRFVPTQTGYEIVFGDRKEHFAGRKAGKNGCGGFDIIYLLLNKPDKLLSPAELLGRHAIPDDPHSRQKAMDDESLQIAFAAREEWRAVINDPKSTDAEKNEAHKMLEKYDHVLGISTYQRKSKDLNGGKAKSDTQNVRNQLKRTYKKLTEAEMRDLSVHLERHIIDQSDCFSYAPPGTDRISWQLAD